MDKTFDYGLMFGKAWEIFRQNALTLVIVTFIIAAFALVVNSAAGRVNGYVEQLAMLLITGPLNAGLSLVCLRAARGRRVQVAEFLEAFPLLGQAILLHIVFFVFCAVGFALCVLPAFLVMTLYLPAYLFMIEDRRGFWDAMESSRKLVLDNFLPWFILLILFVALNVVGLVACLVGTLVTIPLTVLMIVLAYEQQRNGVTPVSADEPLTPPAE